MAELILQSMKYQEIEAYEIKSHSKGSPEPIILDAIATREGVWKGIFRPGQLIKDNVRWLKGKPITLNHPPMSTGGKAFNNLAVGQILDAWYIPEGHQAGVKCELWPNKLPGEILQKIDSQKVVDVSTGFYAAEEPIKGVWQGKDYEAIERSLDFDHLALVPIGACSQADGCGLGLHAQDLSKIDLTGCSADELHEHLNKALGWTCALHHSAEGNETALSETKTFLDRVVGEMLQKDEAGLKSDIFALNPCKRDILLYSYDRVFESTKRHSLESNEANAYKSEVNSKKELESGFIMTKESKEGAGAGDLTFSKAEDLSGFLTTVKGMKPEEQAAQAIKGLETMAGLWTSQKGPFIPVQAPTFPVPVISESKAGEQAAEKLEINWQEGKTPEEAKQAIATAITGFHSKNLSLEKTVGELTEKVSGLTTEIQTIKAHSKQEQLARIKLHSGLSDDEMKPYQDMTPEALTVIADHFQRIKQHSGSGDGSQQTPLDPPAGGKVGKGGKRTREELDALNDQMDAQLGIKSKGKRKE